jgi:hypothetical protein
MSQMNGQMGLLNNVFDNRKNDHDNVHATLFTGLHTSRKKR